MRAPKGRFLWAGRRARKKDSATSKVEPRQEALIANYYAPAAAPGVARIIRSF
jgi:hypothetical protein